MSIESLINNLIHSSTQLMEADKEGDDDYTYSAKIASSIKSGPGEYKVIYGIRRYRQSKVKVSEFYNFKPKTGGIIFNYIFTGQNVDILDFDIKMNMGLAFFHTLNAASSGPTGIKDITKISTREYVGMSKDEWGAVTQEGKNQYYADHRTAIAKKKKLEDTNKSIAGTGEVNTSPKLSNGCDIDIPPRKKPLFLGGSITDSMARNKRIPYVGASYNALLARHAAFESLEAKLKIRGNPQLLEDTTQFPEELQTGDLNDPVVHDFGDGNGRAIMPNPHVNAAYVKVKVFMPNPDANDTNGLDFAQNFWYPGWYRMYSINHVFADGDFTQELELFSIPTTANQEKLDTAGKEQ